MSHLYAKATMPAKQECPFFSRNYFVIVQNLVLILSFFIRLKWSIKLSITIILSPRSYLKKKLPPDYDTLITFKPSKT